MGANFEYEIFDGNLTENELSKKFDEFKADQEYEHGHGSYNGTLATTNGLKVNNTVFENESAASKYVMDNAEKWHEALAVRFKVVETVVKKEPTFGGKSFNQTQSVTDQFEHNSLAMRFVFNGSKNVAVIADQCSAAQKGRLEKVWNDYIESHRSVHALQEQFRGLVRKIDDVNAEVFPEDFKGLKSVRPKYLKALALMDKKRAKLVDLDKKIGAKLYKSEMKDNGVKWMVGGWCAS
jgi:hypothetical protein